MRGMNYKSALIGGPSAQDTVCPSNNIIDQRRFIQDDNGTGRPYNMMNNGIGKIGPVCDSMVTGMVAGGSSGWLIVPTRASALGLCFLLPQEEETQAQRARARRDKLVDG